LYIQAADAVRVLFTCCSYSRVTAIQLQADVYSDHDDNASEVGSSTGSDSSSAYDAENCSDADSSATAAVAAPSFVVVCALATVFAAVLGVLLTTLEALYLYWAAFVSEVQQDAVRHIC
jgi:hypothetical protein